MTRYDLYGVETVFYCFKQTFGTTIQLRQTYLPFVHVLLGDHSYKKIQRMLPCHKNGADTWKLPWALTRGGGGAIREKSRGKWRYETNYTTATKFHN
jgi:hypothetical protein